MERTDRPITPGPGGAHPAIHVPVRNTIVIAWRRCSVYRPRSGPQSGSGARCISRPTLERARVSGYFRDEVLPALTPLAIDISRPFPMLSSLSLNLAFRLAPTGEGTPDDGASAGWDDVEQQPS